MVAKGGSNGVVLIESERTDVLMQLLLWFCSGGGVLSEK